MFRKLSILFVLAWGCAADDAADDAADGTADGTDEEVSSTADELTSSALLEASMVAPAGSAATSIEAALAEARAGVESTWGDCVTVTSTPTSMTWVFAGCIGPFGATTVDGELGLTYRPRRDGSLEAVLESTGLTLNDEPASLSAEATYRATGDVETLEVVSTTTGFGGADDAATSGAYTLVRDASCLGLDGTWSGVGRASWSLDVTDYRVCEDACPDAGGVVSYTRNIRTMQVSYDGDATATWSAAGRSGSLPLACGR